MKTIYVKKVLSGIFSEKHLRRGLSVAGLFLFAFILGGMAARIADQRIVETNQSADNAKRSVETDTAEVSDSGQDMALDPTAETGSGEAAESALLLETDFAEADTAETGTEVIRSDTVNWGLGFGEAGTKPTGMATVEELAQYNAYFMSDTEEKVLYLTFDCGYENGNTEIILDALKAHEAPATFFVVGYFLESAPDLVKRMVKDGHTVGNHTYNHPDMSQISDMASFQKEMEDNAALFEEVTGTQMSLYYRPPQGKYSVENLKMAQELGYATFFWSLAYVDWYQDDQPTHEEAFDKLLTRVHPGAIVLLHNTSSTNAEILDELLTKWEEMGYTFRALSDFVG
ncbi:MAG: polysaccharide deacetylase family protein [Lachnospiraceae bacterium]|nr:polysaccharide deacetylase family protein [Lachnospiraceae bacterium]